MPLVAPVTRATLPVKSLMGADPRTPAPSTSQSGVHSSTDGRRIRRSDRRRWRDRRKESPMEPTITLHGNLVADPSHRLTADGVSLARFRIASSGRRFDKESEGWVNTDAVYMSVSCWRRLADNVRSSLHKGDTVLVQG